MTDIDNKNFDLSSETPHRQSKEVITHFPTVVIKADDSIKILSNDNENDNNNSNINNSTNNLNTSNWTRENIELLRETVLDLVKETSEGIEVRYNFTHLSNILKIDKIEIYNKIIDLYRGDNSELDNDPSNKELTHAGSRAVESPLIYNDSVLESSQPVSVDSLINIGAASKLLHSRHILGRNLERNSSEDEDEDDKESEEESVEESLLEREILETNI